jgi:AraC-like DNA-binding protein
MGFYDGVNFINWGCNSNYTSHFDSSFAGYYGIQYNHMGPVYCAVGENLPRHVNGSYAFITYPGARFRYGPEEGRSRYHMFVCFSGPRVDDYLAGALLEPTSRDPLVPITHFNRFFTDLWTLQEILANRRQSADRAVYLLEGLLLQIKEEKQQLAIGTSDYQQQIDTLAERINLAPSSNWDFRREAARLHVSYTHFRRLFNRFLGCAPGNYLMQSRLNAAAQMLGGADITIAEIAEKNGFYDVHHFSKLFKKHYMLPPATYRREFKGH